MVFFLRALWLSWYRPQHCNLNIPIEHEVLVFLRKSMTGVRAAYIFYSYFLVLFEHLMFPPSVLDFLSIPLLDFASN